MNVYHIQQNETLWRVNVEGPDRGCTSHNQKHEAVKYATMMAKVHRPSKVVVHARDGKVETEFVYPVELVPAATTASAKS